MTLKDFYAAIGGDYEGVIARLCSESFVKKFLFKFMADSSYDTLVKSLNAHDYQEAFRAAHTVKGVCQNLGLGRLLDSSSALTEALRGGSGDGADKLMEKVTEDYNRTIVYLKELQKGEN